MFGVSEEQQGERYGKRTETAGVSSEPHTPRRWPLLRKVENHWRTVSKEQPGLTFICKEHCGCCVENWLEVTRQEEARGPVRLSHSCARRCWQWGWWEGPRAWKEGRRDWQMRWMWCVRGKGDSGRSPRFVAWAKEERRLLLPRRGL